MPRVSIITMHELQDLKWSVPYQIEDIRDDRKLLPNCSGVYVFTSYRGPVERNTGVLYIGKAKSLRKRLSKYLSSPFKILLLSPKKRDKKLSRSLRHTGKNLLLMEIQQKSRYGQSGMWLRWAEKSNPSVLEKALIIYYEPSFNTSLNPRIKRGST